MSTTRGQAPPWKEEAIPTGCDIHLRVEKRTSMGWEPAEAMVPNPWHEKYPDEYPDPLEPERWYSGRNYNLFTVLAGVRSPKNALDETTIAEPRGVPEDVSPNVAEDIKHWGEDGHSHSYFTLAELIAHDWDTPARDSAYSQGKKDGESDEDYRTRFTRAVEVLHTVPNWAYPMCQWSSELERPDHGGWVWVEWEIPSRYHIGGEWPWLMLRMLKAAPDGDPERIRAVFWFDN